MSDMVRAFFQWFGIRYVVLIDFDGERNIRRVVWRGGQACAWRVGLGISMVQLLDGGRVRGVSYVSGWAPYDAAAPKTLPSFPATD